MLPTVLREETLRTETESGSPDSGSGRMHKNLANRGRSRGWTPYRQPGLVPLSSLSWRNGPFLTACSVSVSPGTLGLTGKIVGVEKETIKHTEMGQQWV